MFDLKNLEEWESKYYQDWCELERELNRKVYIGELVIRKIRKENIQPKYHLNIRERTIPIFEFHLKEPLYVGWISKLDQAFQLVDNYAKIGTERIYVTPSRICNDYPTAGADKRNKLVYFPLAYLLLPNLKLPLHVWHENTHLLLPEQKNKVDDSEEFVTKKLSYVFGQTIIRDNWNPKYDLSSCGADKLTWNKKTAMKLLEILEDYIDKDILEKTQKEINNTRPRSEHSV